MASPKLTVTTDATNPVAHDLELDATGQPVWIGGDITDRSSYATMVSQRLRCRWMMWKGEWYMDQRLGTPWEQALFRKGVTEDLMRSTFRQVALGTPGVRAVVRVDVTFDRAARSATIDFELTMEDRLPVSTAQLDAPFVVELPQLLEAS